jgi:3-hydroxyisobutyrate dehydrogenase-like beta-hydroxyacid dehydrogenase
MSDGAQPAIGFIGLGDQGLPIAQAIADNGYALHVWARRPQSLDGLKGFSYTAEDSVQALARVSDIVALCLSEDSDNLQVATDGGLLAAMRPGSILVNHGTGLPEATRHLADLAKPYGVTVVDAPVSGGHTVALARQLTTIAGGPDDAIERLTPVFKTFSKKVIHMGSTGAGQFGKLFNNTLMMMNHKNVIDVLALARQLDLPMAPLLDVLRSGSASSVALMAFGPSITPDNAEHLRELELIDMDLFSGAVTTLGDAAGDVVGRAVNGAQGLPELTAVIADAQ